MTNNRESVKSLPENLFAAHQWISSAGEWNEAVADPESYSREAAQNAIENEWFDVTEQDLRDVIRWHSEQ